MSEVISLRGVDLVFGRRPQAAFALLAAGSSPAEVTARTGQTVAMRDVSLAVNEGELLVVMGLSGSGKSSLVRCINGLNGRGGDGGTLQGEVLVTLDDGTVVDLGSCSAAVLRRLRMRHVAMVFQQFGLMPWRTLGDNVGFALELQGVAAPERRRRIEEQLAMVQLGAWQHRYPHEASGGMQQRVGLARAFVTNSRILLMDEPFSALDPLIRRQLQDELLSLKQRLRKTIVFISHDFDEALRLGSRIAVMQGGRILQVGTPRDIVGSPACAEVRRFVSHANPLSILTGACIMTRLADLSVSADGVDLDGTGRFRCRFDGDGRLLSARIGDGPGTVRHLDAELLAAEITFAESDLIIAPAGLPMQQAVALLHRTRRPLLLAGEDRRCVGVVADREILRGLVGPMV